MQSYEKLSVKQKNLFFFYRNGVTSPLGNDTKKKCNCQRKNAEHSSEGGRKSFQNNGAAVQALGALMRIDLAIVGAILSVVTGCCTRAAGMPAP